MNGMLQSCAHTESKFQSNYEMCVLHTHMHIVLLIISNNIVKLLQKL